MAGPFKLCVKDKAIIICHSATYERDLALSLGFHAIVTTINVGIGGNQISICSKKKRADFYTGRCPGLGPT